MKPKISFSSKFIFALFLSANLPHVVSAQDFIWDGAPDGGGASANVNWSTATNWQTDTAPLATGQTLAFDGTTGLSNINDLITDAGTIAVDNETTAFTFEVGAGSFVLDDDGIVGPITVCDPANDNHFVKQFSPNPQAIASDIALAGGGKFRRISFGTGAGSLTLSGALDFSNSWLQIPGTSEANTILLNGDNFGPGAGNKVNGNGNNMRSTLRNDRSGMTISLGSPAALGNPSSSLGTPGQLIGINLNQTSTLTSTLDLTGANKLDNALAYNGSVNYDSPFDLEMNALINTATNGRGVGAFGAGSLSFTGEGYYITSRTTAQLGILQGDGGDVTVTNLHDTFQAGGIETLAQSIAGMAWSHFRKQGTNTLTITGDNRETFRGEMRHRTGTVVLGHQYALGPWGGTDLTLQAGTIAGDPSVDVTNATGIAIGQTVTGPGIPAGAKVIAFDFVSFAPTILVTLDSNATASGSVELNFSETPDMVVITPTVTNLSNVITVPDATGIGIGFYVQARGVPGGTSVTEIDTSVDPVAITLSQTADQDVNNRNAVFGRPGPSQVEAAATLDLNGLTIGETFSQTEGTIINSDTTNPAEILSEIHGAGNFTVAGPGDITLNVYAQRLATVGRNLTKNGTGTLTIGGDTGNDRFGLIVNSGNVNIAKTAGNAINNNPLVMNAGAGTVKLVGTANTMLNDSIHAVIEGGTWDLNGIDEALGGLESSSTTGTITNNGLAPATLTVGAGSAATNRIFSGTITDGSGLLNLTKGNAFTQTLTGPLSYTGDTTINNGILELAGAASTLDNDSAVLINGDGGLLLADGVIEVVDQLWLNGVQQPAGTYGSNSSTATNKDNFVFVGGTGILSVTSDPVAGSDYDSWAASFNLTGGSTDDDDNDGVSNEDEYAFGTDPTNNSSTCPITAILEKSAGTFSYTRRDPALTSLTYTVYTSTTLEASDWNLDAAAAQAAGATDGNGNQTVEVTLSTPPTAPKFFVRIEAN